MRYVPDLIRWARRCGVPAGDAPDVAQIAAVRAWRGWETSNKPPERRAPWLFVIVARVASLHRRRTAKRPLDFRDPGEMEHAPDEAPLADEGRDERAGLASLEQLRAGTTPERWRLFFGHEVEGVAVAALAKREGLRLSTAYNRLRLARRDLAATIAREAAAERTRLTLARSRTPRTKGRR
jgi:RNA polymerase sigma-70 factor (ECF subfamily)